MAVGIAVGVAVGNAVGVAVGNVVGVAVGNAVGVAVGAGVGAEVGVGVGSLPPHDARTKANTSPPVIASNAFEFIMLTSLA